MYALSSRSLLLLAAPVLSGFLSFQPAQVQAALPELPRVFLDTTYTPPVGNTIAVNAGGNLQAAINNALPGDTIVLQAGATFTGTFSLPNKGSSTNWIYIRSSAYSSLPLPGNRVGPANAASMPAIVAGPSLIALMTQDGAHHYRFVGVEIRPGPGMFVQSLIRTGSAAETSLSQIPHDIVFDRCYIHGDATIGGRRGIALNSAATSVIDSYLSDWKDPGSDSQAIDGWTTPGPVKLVNNYFEAAAENVAFGGADPLIANLVPSDIEIRGNRFAKPLAWRQQNWLIKNLFELKNARRVLVEGNIFENVWAAAQDFAINIKSAQAGTAPWSVTEDLTFRNNIVRHAPSAMKFCAGSCDNGTSTALGGRYLVQNNLFYDISSAAWGGAGIFFQTGVTVPNLTFSHNTAIHDGSTFNSGDPGNAGFQFTDNIVQRGPYGFKGGGASEGIGTLTSYFPAYIFTRNVIVGADPASYPSNSFFPASIAAVGFVNVAGNDYRLGTSSYKNAATDGKDVGADIVAVNTATACATDGQCGAPTPPPPPPPPPLPPPDTTPPLISAVVATAVTDTQAVIGWATDEAADTQLEYGITTAYGNSSSLNPAAVTSHSQGMSGLSASTAYHYRVKSRDSAGNLATSGDFALTTLGFLDTIAPSIPTGLAVSNVRTSRMTIAWNASTDNVAVAGYRLDMSTDIGFTTFVSTYQNRDVGNVTSFRVTNLARRTEYFFRVRAYDATGNVSANSVWVSAHSG